MAEAAASHRGGGGGGGGFEDPAEAAHMISSDDLRPIPKASRTMSGWDMAGLWVGMVVNVPSFYLAGSLVELGMSWWQGVTTIILGNTILLAPLILTAQPGTRYGISFPVLARSSFGIRGAHIPGLLRALVACGWCGIETWIGGQAVLLLLPPSLRRSSCAQTQLPWLGTSLVELSCFVLFWVIQLAILWRGMGGIRVLQSYSAPLLIALTAWLFFWAYFRAGGFGGMLSTPSSLGPSEFWWVFFPSLTASISSWSSVALNIADFTRHSKSQAGQVAGQLGLPVFMGLYTFAGLAITSSTEVIFGRVISNPIQLLEEIGGGPLIAILAATGIGLATVTTNIPANFVAPANVLVSLSPSQISFLGGSLLTALVGTIFQPWRILQSSENFVYTWLVGYSAVLGPISGILLADYYILRRMSLDVSALYSSDPLAPYYYARGYNVAAIVSLILTVLPTVPGFLHKVGAWETAPQAFIAIYDNAWFFGIFAAAIIYWLLSWFSCRGTCKPAVAPSFLEPLQPGLE